MTSPGAPAGYMIVERRLDGRLDADWDGEIHPTREAAQAELALANHPDEDDPTQTPGDHWKLYELREVRS